MQICHPIFYNPTGLAVLQILSCCMAAYAATHPVSIDLEKKLWICSFSCGVGPFLLEVFRCGWLSGMAAFTQISGVAVPSNRKRNLPTPLQESLTCHPASIYLGKFSGQHVLFLTICISVVILSLTSKRSLYLLLHIYDICFYFIPWIAFSFVNYFRLVHIFLKPLTSVSRVHLTSKMKKKFI